jgi:Flp pilus assembly protein TadG
MFERMSRGKSERGAAAVETALTLCFVVLPVVFGAISYAYMLSFRQTLSQSAGEGARAAAVAPSVATTAQRQAAAINAVNNSMASNIGASMTCGVDNLTCTAVEGSCTNGSGTCITVTVSYPYRDHSLLPSIPGLGFTLPSVINYTATAKVG